MNRFYQGTHVISLNLTVNINHMTIGIRDNNSILSIDLNQDEDEIIIERDSPGYSSFQCLSDIGTSLLWSIDPYTMAHTMSL